MTNVTWSQNGSILANADTLDLNTLQTTIGETFLCTINAVDPNGGVATSSLQTTIVNRMPDPPTIEINPTEPVEGVDDLVCQVTSSTTDSDGQTLTFTYEWLQNGISHSTVPVVDASETTAGEAVISQGDIAANEFFIVANGEFPVSVSASGSAEE